MRDREPGLAGAGGAVPKDKLVALERAHVGVLAGGAGPHRALAQIDLLEGCARGCGIEIEERALRDREPNRALDIPCDRSCPRLICS
jgi:hypothetical protein